MKNNLVIYIQVLEKKTPIKLHKFNLGKRSSYLKKRLLYNKITQQLGELMFPNDRFYKSDIYLEGR